MSKILTAALVAAFLTGCATSSAVLIGTARPAIQPQQVKIYVDAPRKFEKVALIEANSAMAMAITEQGKMDAVILKLKEEAAKIGANGVLLASTGNQTQAGAIIMPMAGGGMMAMPANSQTKNATATAIFVTEE